MMEPGGSVLRIEQSGFMRRSYVLQCRIGWETLLINIKQIPEMMSFYLALPSQVWNINQRNNTPNQFAEMGSSKGGIRSFSNTFLLNSLLEDTVHRKDAFTGLVY